MLVLWTAEAISWLHVHTQEATVVLTDASLTHPTTSGTPMSLASMQHGRFWQVLDTSGLEMEVVLAEALPADAGSAWLGRVVGASMRWLRHNITEELTIKNAPCTEPSVPNRAFSAVSNLPSISFAKDLEGSSEALGWLLAAEVKEDGTGILSAFRPLSSPMGCCLVRVLFQDRSRLETLLTVATTPAPWAPPSAPSATDVFRFLDSTGAVKRRSFAEPWGCEVYAEATRRLLARLFIDEESEQKTTLIASVLAENECRRSEALLKLQHVTPFITYINKSTAESEGCTSSNPTLVTAPLALCASAALKRNREACGTIASLLSVNL